MEYPMWVMIAGPYRSGAESPADHERNLAALNRAAFAVFRKGHVPLLAVNLALPIIAAGGPETYEAVMLPLSLALADRCDAVLRLDGASSGADAEVERIVRRGGTVYRSLAEIPDARDPGAD